LDFLPTVVAALAFGAVGAFVLLCAQIYSARAHVNRRLPAPVALTSDGFAGPPRSGLDAFVARFIDERRLGIDRSPRGKLRRDLLKAGYFGADAVNIYIVARLACALIPPALAYVFIAMVPREIPLPAQLGFVALVALVGFAAPDAYVARRQRLLLEQYRLVFPDLLDLLVVCVDAGLGLDAALERVRPEIAKRCRELGLNLEMMGAETRAGRSTPEALESLADRLGLEEALSFVSMLRQSIELGSDVGDALRVFSDEMRDKRLMRAEESANKLTVKMVLPLGLFIFPVVLLVVMLPVIIKLMGVLGKG
jgi:tight adherence protein C